MRESESGCVYAEQVQVRVRGSESGCVSMWEWMSVGADALLRKELIDKTRLINKTK